MRLSVLTVALGAVIATQGAAEVVAPADVVFGEYGEVEASLTGTMGDPENGAKIMKTKSIGNCISCHAVSALSDAPFHGEVGPSLDGAADRWTEAQLRGILTNSKLTFEGTVMPAYYKVTGFIRPGNAYTGKAAPDTLPPLLEAQQIEDVIAFLGTLKDE